MTQPYDMHTLCQQLQAMALNYGYNARALREVRMLELLPHELRTVFAFEKGTDDTDDCFRLQDLVIRLSCQSQRDLGICDSFASRRVLNHHRINRFFTTTEEL